MLFRASRAGSCRFNHARQQGFTLVELMVSILLGFVLIAGVLSIFISNRQVYQTTDNLARVQENVRSAFDFMARDIRESGQTPCGSPLVANVIRNSGGTIPWWADWNLGTLIGVDGGQNRTDIVAIGTAAGDRVTATDAILIIRTEQDEKTMVSHDASTQDIVLNDVDGLNTEDVVIGCDLKAAAIFQIGTISNSTKTINYDKSMASLNCSNSLGFPTPSGCGTPPAKSFDAKGLVSKLNTAFWYIGIGSNGGRSLYRTRIIKKTVAGVPTITTEAEELVTGVHDMQIEYLTRASGTLATDWVNASNGTSFPGATATATGNWRTDDLGNQPNIVVAARITLTLQTEDSVGSNQQPITKTLIHVVNLRIREPQTLSGP